MTRSVTSFVRVAVVQCDNRAVARAALCRLLENQPGFVLAGESGSHEESVAMAVETKPDVIILDSGASPEKETELLSALSAEFSTLGKGPRILVLTSTNDDLVHSQFVRAGALGLVKQEQPVDILFRAINCLQDGEIWLERSMAARVMRDTFHPRPIDPNNPQKLISLLNEREIEVITFVCEGLKNQAIAKSLFVSEATVRHRLTSIFEKLQISDRLELVIFAYRHGLVELPR